MKFYKNLIFSLLKTHKNLINPNGDIIKMCRKVTDVIERGVSFDSHKALMIAGSRQVSKTYSVEKFWSESSEVIS